LGRTVREELEMTSQCETGRIEATLIPGDGIGPEIVEAAQIVLDGLGSPFAWDVRQAGMAAIHPYSSDLGRLKAAGDRFGEFAGRDQ
jgi:hypothetical protein